MGKFTVDTTKHVKIWFSKDPNTFLPFTNQLRLVRFREQNPDAELNIIYSSKMLNDKSKLEFQQFCARYRFNAVDFDTDLKAMVEQSSGSDQQLYSCAKQELEAVSNIDSGNLAAASDIIRWIDPVRIMGCYADFDVDVNTKELDDTLSVESPLVVSLGSVISDFRLFCLIPLKQQLRAAPNNDILLWATAQDEAAQAEQQSFEQAVDRVKRQIIGSYRNVLGQITSHGITYGLFSRMPTLYSPDFLNSSNLYYQSAIQMREKLMSNYNSEESLMRSIRGELFQGLTLDDSGNSWLYSTLCWIAVKLHLMTDPGPSSLKLRFMDFLNSVYKPKLSDSFSPKEVEQIHREFQELMVSSLKQMQRSSTVLSYVIGLNYLTAMSMINNPLTKPQSYEDFVEQLMASGKTSSVIEGVTKFTGPWMINSLLDKLGVVETDSVFIDSSDQEKVAQFERYSVQHYPEIANAFVSTQAMPLNDTDKSQLKRIETAAGDHSFTTKGQANMKRKDEEYDKAARVLQRFFKRHIETKKSDNSAPTHPAPPTLQ